MSQLGRIVDSHFPIHQHEANQYQQQQAHHGPYNEINVVPYIDVMLVLLIIFMVTAPMITPSVIDL
ncbi:biopolymer transporter ExbD [Mycobacterium tuberculosis]|uniref:biopolymer transporter ExbD n=1 Tax=Mycobacterium tuberculosis TaxID=1773 RepID=UPI003F886A9D